MVPMAFFESRLSSLGPYLCDAFIGAAFSSGQPIITKSEFSVSWENGARYEPR